jgi:hypothetical protein
MPPRRAWLEKPAVLAAIATLAASLWLIAHVAIVCDGNWTALFLHGDKFGVPAELAPGTYVFPHSSGYDGQFYRMLAHDPSLSKGWAVYMDAPLMRSRRILLPALAWLLAGGQPGAIDAAYIGLNFVALFAGVYFSARWLLAAGCAPGWALGFLVLPATVAGFERMVTDLFFTGLFAGYLWSAREGRWKWLWLFTAALCLTRETGLLCAAGAVAWFGARRDAPRAAGFAAAALPAAAWYGYLYFRLGWRGVGGEQFDSPVVGVLRRIVTKLAEWQGVSLAHSFEWLAAVCYASALCLAVWWLVRRRGTWTVEMPALALMTALFWLMGQAGYMAEPMGYGRAASPLLLALFINGVAENRWLMAASALGVGVGTLTYWTFSLKRIAVSLFRL